MKKLLLTLIICGALVFPGIVSADPIAPGGIFGTTKNPLFDYSQHQKLWVGPSNPASIWASMDAGSIMTEGGGGTGLIYFGSIGHTLYFDGTIFSFSDGITINQAAGDGEILSLKSSDVAHTITTDTEADTYGLMKKYSATVGGVLLRGLTDATGTGLALEGIIGATDPTDTDPAILMIGSKQTGTTTDALGAAETVWQLKNRTTNLITVLGNGNTGFGGVVSFGTSAAKVIGVPEGTAPTTSPADMSQVWSANLNGVAGANRLHTRTETGANGALAILSETAIYYGLAWDESADTYTRTGRLATQALNVSPPSDLLSVHASMRRCVLTDAGAVAYYLSSTDSTKKEDGVTAANLDGTDGQVMVEVPKFWYRHRYIGTTHYWEISPTYYPGFSVHPAFIKDGTEVDNRYIGAYEGILYDTSRTAYTNGIYQTAVSAAFATADDSITIATRSNWASTLAVGDKLVITGTVSNNATVTVASILSGTAITVSENLTDETAASTVIQTQKDWAATTGDKLGSVSGFAPINYGTRANFRVAATNRGAGWRSLDYDLLSAIQLLFLVEYGSFYSQSVIGAGITNVTDWNAYNNYNPITKTGNSNSVGDATGNNAGSASAATESTKYLSYRGIENWFGHIWKWTDGININSNQVYVTNTASAWADDTATGYTSIGTAHNADGWQSTLLNIARGFLPKAVGASSSTKITDYYYQASGWRVVAVGGGAADGGVAGAFSLAADGGSGGAYRYVGGRLCY